MRPARTRMSGAGPSATRPCETPTRVNDVPRAPASAGPPADPGCTRSCRELRCAVAHGVDDPLIGKASIGQPRTVGVRTLDAPAVCVADQRHLTPISPPAVDLTGQRDPEVMPIAAFVQIPQQLDVDVTFPSTGNVIRMRDHADESVVAADQVDLLLPQINRVVVEDVEERVVLDRR